MKQRLKNTMITKSIIFICLVCLIQACGIKGKPLPPIRQPFTTPNAEANTPEISESTNPVESTNKNLKKEKAKK